MKDNYTENLWDSFRNNPDSKSFRALYDCTYEPLCRYAAFIIGDRWESEEIVLDFFSHLWQHRSEVRDITSAYHYLFTSIRNRCFNFMRSNHPHMSLDEIMYKETPSELTSIDYEDLLLIIQDAIISLSPKCQEVFTKSRTQNLSYDEIADDMGISVKTVEVHMSKALKKLRIAVKKFYLLSL